MNYADAKRRAGAIAAAVEKRHMPPWLPERGGPAFAGERGLREAQISMVRRRADAGAPEGDPSERPRPLEIDSTYAPARLNLERVLRLRAR